jgi:hypothetical protein
MTSKVIISEELSHFIKEHANDHCALQLILFFAIHPYARFSELAITHALNQNGGRRSLQKVLRNLVDRGIIRKCIENNVLLYSLSDNSSMRSLVLELARLDVQQRWLLLRQACNNSVTRGLEYKYTNETLEQSSLRIL